jgi:hypothetical protein
MVVEVPLLGVWGISRQVNIEKNGGDLKVANVSENYGKTS